MNDFFKKDSFSVAEFAATNDLTLRQANEAIDAINIRVNCDIDRRWSVAAASLAAAGDNSTFWLVGSEGRFESLEHWGVERGDGVVLENKRDTLARQAQAFA